MEMMVNVGHEQ